MLVAPDAGAIIARRNQVTVLLSIDRVRRLPLITRIRAVGCIVLCRRDTAISRGRHINVLRLGFWSNQGKSVCASFHARMMRTDQSSNPLARRGRGSALIDYFGGRIVSVVRFRWHACTSVLPGEAGAGL